MIVRFTTASAVIVALVASASSAYAQDAIIEGPGILVGESTVFRPTVGVEAGVISNVFYQEAEPELAPVVRLLVGMDLAPGARDRHGDDTVGSPAIDFQLGVDLQYNEYLSSNPNVREQRNLDAELHGEVTFNPEGKVALLVADRFLRQSRPTNFESSGQLTRDRNHGLIEGRYQPGGRTIQIGARYENVIDVFESEASSFADRIQHTFGVKGKWRFFPYSQAWVDASLGFYGPLNEQPANAPLKVSSSPMRLTMGLDSSLTELTSVNAYAGYANGFYDEGPSYKVPVGGVLFGWRYAPTGRVTLGYSYDVYDSINANFFAEHRFATTITQDLFGRMRVLIGAGLHFRTYEGVPVALSPLVVREDSIVDASLRAEYLAWERLSFYLEAIAQSVSTDFRDVNGDDPSYFRAEILGGATAAF